MIEYTQDGEDSVAVATDRKYQGGKLEAMRIDGNDGTVTVGGRLVNVSIPALIFNVGLTTSYPEGADPAVFEAQLLSSTEPGLVLNSIEYITAGDPAYVHFVLTLPRPIPDDRRCVVTGITIPHSMGMGIKIAPYSNLVAVIKGVGDSTLHFGIVADTAFGTPGVSPSLDIHITIAISSVPAAVNAEVVTFPVPG